MLEPYSDDAPKAARNEERYKWLDKRIEKIEQSHVLDVPRVKLGPVLYFATQQKD
jgi:hypothetical protein